MRRRRGGRGCGVAPAPPPPRRRILESDQAHPVKSRLLEDPVDIGARRQRHRLQPGYGLDDLERLTPDRARRAEHDHAPLHNAFPPL